MKILHLMLSCFYIDNYNYQENVLPRQNKLDGHEVQIIASTQTFINNLHLGYVKNGAYINEDGILVTRVPYKTILNQFISSKLKIYQNIYSHINSFSPDIIFCHGSQTYEIKTLIKYKKNHPETRIFIDSHADFNNSATNFISKRLLHGFYYKWLLRKSLPYIENIFCISYESLVFLERMYKISHKYLVLYPLGGEILDDNIRNSKRNKIREMLSIQENELLLLHCGKMNKDKRSVDLIRAFHDVKKSNIKLLLIGSMTEEVELATRVFIENDERISYLGWKNANDLKDFLCAGDLYIQPGSQSATMQNALCYGCAAALFPHESHKYLLDDLVFYVDSINDMEQLFEKISSDSKILEDKRRKSWEFAKLNLDYKKLAAKYY